FHPRRCTAGAGDRSRRQCAEIDRHHGVHWHAGVDAAGGAVCAIILRRHATLRGMAEGTQAPITTSASTELPSIRGGAHMKTGRVLVSTLLCCGLWFSSAVAQTYPDHVIKVIVPFVPGSPVDTAARVITQQAGLRLGQSMVVENRPG